jgi:putative FmdB family regulatory protein
MPTYVYECAKCGDEFELYQSFSDDPLKKHPGCGGKVAKVFQPVGIVLKGSGFYKNDSRNGTKRAKSDSAGDSSKSDAKSGTTTADSSTAKSDSSSSTTKSDSAKSSDKGSDKKASTPAAKST